MPMYKVELTYRGHREPRILAFSSPHHIVLDDTDLEDVYNLCLTVGQGDDEVEIINVYPKGIRKGDGTW